MNILTTPIKDLLIIEPKVHGDARGWFMESYSKRDFDAAVGRPVQFVQDNHSFSRRGVLRGLHYQLPPNAQGKLVRVTRGVVWDVAVDIRRSSPTFGQHHAIELSADNQRQYWIPEGFAHGFVVLSDTADFLYKTTACYAPQSDRALKWDDVTFDIPWPLNHAHPETGELLGQAVQISDKDRAAAAFSQRLAESPTDLFA